MTAEDQTTAVPDAATAPEAAAAPPAKIEEPSVTVSPGFGQLLTDLGVSLLVSTYDAGKVFLLRAVGPSLNIHFVAFERAMGIAADASRIIVGSKLRIHELYNMPALIPRVPEAAIKEAKHDACFVPRLDYVTGDIQIHEMALSKGELWFVNTRFSCLCTLNPPHSFAPRWRPPFIKGLSADDRCHLNGLAMVDGKPAFVSAFAVTDEPQGWRPTKATSGIIMEVPSGKVVATGLSMPHSPRWYANHLWILDSGHGTLARIDPATQRAIPFAELSGFTRGLDFHGPIAFVGLSKVRESNVFGGLPLTERLPLEERFCGIQAINLTTGKIVGSVKFDAGVHEIFAVQVLPNMRFPALLEFNDPLVDSCYALSNEALRDVRPTEAPPEKKT